MEHFLKVLLWGLFFISIGSLTYIGASTSIKENFKGNTEEVEKSNTQTGGTPTQKEINIYYPGMTIISFNDTVKKNANADIYQSADYNSWVTPKLAADPRTNNMFSAANTPSGVFVGPVQRSDPFATSAPPNSHTQFGPLTFDPL